MILGDMVISSTRLGNLFFSWELILSIFIGTILADKLANWGVGLQSIFSGSAMPDCGF